HASGQPWIAVPNNCGLTIYRLTTDASGVSRLQQVWRDQAARPTTPVYANGVLYAVESGALRAWDATSGKRLWGSDQGGAGGSIGGIHWQSPILVDGALYISDEDGALTCYGLKP
ncbi:MAG: PQQ-binding-like beta-propeller repeat protein, partial [Ktedonobacterales bacterium]